MDPLKSENNISKIKDSFIIVILIVNNIKMISYDNLTHLPPAPAVTQP